ncbi:hypothetical protein B9Z55_001609 [Caenorhabditis nigoni]|uniref:Uncharacterized protein n=1 Tax=Caenorhabditis nigoni TaxID=1611254 RepID=A0A2G5VGH8_9PELO|nr:hypothetical protein B9Z55_001609 [Caenorhabditis nigoni]
MDEQSPDAAARRRSLQIAKQTTTTKDFQEPSHYTNSTATSKSLSTLESPEDVPSKSNGPKDITITSTDWQKEFQRTLEFQNQRHSVSMQSPREGDQANGSDTPVTSSAKLNRQLKVSRQFQSSKLLPRGEVLSSSAVWACQALEFADDGSGSSEDFL